MAAASLLTLPPELLLQIFQTVPNHRTLRNLALTHPLLTSIYTSNRSIILSALFLNPPPWAELSNDYTNVVRISSLIQDHINYASHFNQPLTERDHRAIQLLFLAASHLARNPCELCQFGRDGYPHCDPLSHEGGRRMRAEPSKENHNQCKCVDDVVDWILLDCGACDPELQKSMKRVWEIRSLRCWYRPPTRICEAWDWEVWRTGQGRLRLRSRNKRREEKVWRSVLRWMVEAPVVN